MGGWAGAIAGGKLGSSVGCFAGPPGVLIGGVIGAVIGSHYGSVVVEIKYWLWNISLQYKDVLQLFGYTCLLQTIPFSFIKWSPSVIYKQKAIY